MFEDGTKIIMADGHIKDIHNVSINSFVMCEDGTVSKVIDISRDMQTTYQLTQRTKHRVFESVSDNDDPRRKIIYERLEMKCSLGHVLHLRMTANPVLENSFKKNNILVRWKILEDIATTDGRIIRIPKHHHKGFPLTPEGKYEALLFAKNVKRDIGEYLVYDIEVRDLDYLDGQTRSISKLCCYPISGGNGTLSHFLTGQRHLNTPAVLNMAWLLGLWLGDGTTLRPEISVDHLDNQLMESLTDLCRPWGLRPDYTDAAIPLRAKHVKLYYGEKPKGKKYWRNCKTDNPFWNTVLELKFKNDIDGTKQIPQFMWSEDIEVREAFLAGLIDSDGYVSKTVDKSGKNKVSIQTIYPSIMSGIVQISRSLGITATVTTKPERTSIVKGKTVQCKFTFDCGITANTSLQNVLSYCQSGHKKRDMPLTVRREPVYFSFTDEKRGLNHVYSLKLENSKRILLANKISVHGCSDNCMKEQPKLSQTKNLKRCIACPRVGVKYFYRDWTGKHKVCSRCYSRYKFSGFRCISCNFVPDAREIKKMKGNGAVTSLDGIPILHLPCSRCEGILTFDAVRGPGRQLAVNRIV